MADIYFYKSITGQVYNFRDDRVDSISGALPATEAPLMDGTAAVGTSIKYAREDHVHPADTNKVDKEAGKGLSTNDFTTAEKNKLAGIAAGAEVNVQSDWNVTSTSSDAYIKNKPTIPTETSQLTNDSNFVSDANYVHTDNNFTTTLKNKLNGIASGAEVNVQSDWNQTDTAADDYIKNKPSLLALGETSTTAYRGDRGKTAYTHATDSSRLTTATASGLYKVASTAQGHIASLTAVTKADITGLGIPAQDTTYSEATSSAYGLVKIGYTASGKNYPVQLSSGKMYVNVPWTDTTYSAGSNITLTGTVFSLTKANVTGALGYTPPTSDTTYSEATSSAYGLVKIGYSESGKNYAVKLSSGKMYVNVPWTDTTYTPASATPNNIGTAAVGTSTKYAREDHVHAISLATGDSNGQVKIAGTNVSVKGLGALAYKASLSASEITDGITGVKGQKESTYRTGDVNLTTLNIGAFHWTNLGNTLASGANVDTLLTNGDTYYSADSTVSGTLTGTPPTTGSGFKLFQGCGYGTGRQYQIALANDVVPYIRYRTSSTGTWGDWRRFCTVTNGTAVGGTTTPVYAGADGVIHACSYTLAKSVPSDAKFTDTTYSAGNNITLTGTVFSLTKANVTGALGYTPPTSDTTYSEATSSAYGLVKIGYSESGKNYAVKLSSGKMYVNVPWTDTTYSAGTGLSLSGTTFSNSGATGVKGNAETSYRTGNVNLTPANIGAKAVQTAVTDPTASGTSATFIATISQNAQGVITPTKKTVRSATASQSGLMSAADKEKLDRMNGMVNYRNYDNGAQSTITMTSEVCMVFFMRDAGRYGLYLCSYWTNTIVKIAGTQTSVTTEGNAKISKNANSSYIYLDNTTGSSLAVMIIGGYISDYEIP